mgnify:CR=1 FL=1
MSIYARCAAIVRDGHSYVCGKTMAKYSCGSHALYRSPAGDLVFGKWYCGATLRCQHCAKKRARSLLLALARVQPPQLKLCHLTVTFKPSLGVTFKNISKVRHAVLEHLRRALRPSLLEYVCVVEKHQSGKPHLHIAIWYTTVRALQRDARAVVKGSHVRAKLVADELQLAYLSKYVGKQSSAKITSSRNVARLAMKPPSGWELISVKPAHLTELEWIDIVKSSWEE